MSKLDSKVLKLYFTLRNEGYRLVVEKSKLFMVKNGEKIFLLNLQDPLANDILELYRKEEEIAKRVLSNQFFLPSTMDSYGVPLVKKRIGSETVLVPPSLLKNKNVLCKIVFVDTKYCYNKSVNRKRFIINRLYGLRPDFHPITISTNYKKLPEGLYCLVKGRVERANNTRFLNRIVRVELAEWSKRIAETNLDFSYPSLQSALVLAFAGRNIVPSHVSTFSILQVRRFISKLFFPEKSIPFRFNIFLTLIGRRRLMVQRIVNIAGNGEEELSSALRFSSSKEYYLVALRKRWISSRIIYTLNFIFDMNSDRKVSRIYGRFFA